MSGLHHGTPTHAPVMPQCKILHAGQLNAGQNRAKLRPSDAIWLLGEALVPDDPVAPSPTNGSQTDATTETTERPPTNIRRSSPKVARKAPNRPRPSCCCARSPAASAHRQPTCPRASPPSPAASAASRPRRCWTSCWRHRCERDSIACLPSDTAHRRKRIGFDDEIRTIGTKAIRYSSGRSGQV